GRRGRGVRDGGGGRRRVRGPLAARRRARPEPPRAHVRGAVRGVDLPVPGGPPARRPGCADAARLPDPRLLGGGARGGAAPRPRPGGGGVRAPRGDGARVHSAVAADPPRAGRGGRPVAVRAPRAAGPPRTGARRALRRPGGRRRETYPSRTVVRSVAARRASASSSGLRTCTSDASAAS